MRLLRILLDGDDMRIGRIFFDINFDKELFWIDRKQGGRLYLLFNIGMYDMSHIGEDCKALSITIPFASFKICRIAKTKPSQ